MWPAARHSVSPRWSPRAADRARAAWIFSAADFMSSLALAPWLGASFAKLRSRLLAQNKRSRSNCEWLTHSRGNIPPQSPARLQHKIFISCISWSGPGRARGRPRPYAASANGDVGGPWSFLRFLGRITLIGDLAVDRQKCPRGAAAALEGDQAPRISPEVSLTRLPSPPPRVTPASLPAPAARRPGLVVSV